MKAVSMCITVLVMLFTMLVAFVSGLIAGV